MLFHLSEEKVKKKYASLPVYGRRNGKKHGVECVKINERAEVKQKKGAGLRKEIKGL